MTIHIFNYKMKVQQENCLELQATLPVEYYHKAQLVFLCLSLSLLLGGALLVEGIIPPLATLAGDGRGDQLNMLVKGHLLPTMDMETS